MCLPLQMTDNKYHAEKKKEYGSSEDWHYIFCDSVIFL